MTRSARVESAAPSIMRLLAPAGVAQSTSPVHQFSVEGMFTRADSQKIERLLDEPVRDLGILAQTARQSLLARIERARFLADKQARGETRLAPGSVRSCSDRFHGAKAKPVARALQIRWNSAATWL